MRDNSESEDSGLVGWKRGKMASVSREDDVANDVAEGVCKVFCDGSEVR